MNPYRKDDHVDVSSEPATPPSCEPDAAPSSGGWFASGGLRQAKRIAVAVVGLTVLAIGAAMLVLPGPAFVVIPVGLGILATEFVWARRLLKTLKERAQNVMQRAARPK